MYSTDYADWKGWGPESFGTLSTEQRLYFSAELRRTGIPSLRGQRVMEVGFGDGQFGSWVLNEGGQWAGTELIPELVTRACELGRQAYVGTFPESLWMGETDLIAAFDVVEHMSADDAIDFISWAAARLRPGGILIARVPSGDSPFGRAVQNGDLTHRVALGSSAIRQMASTAALDVVRIEGARLPTRGLGPLRFLRRGAVATARWFVFPFIRVVLMGAHGAVLEPVMTFALQRPGGQIDA